MGLYTVRQGDSTSSIAFRHGLLPETIWDHPSNADLKGRRADRNVLHPSDMLFVPERRERDESGATEERHSFRRKGVPETLRIRVMKYEGEAPQDGQAEDGQAARSSSGGCRARPVEKARRLRRRRGARLAPTPPTR